MELFIGGQVWNGEWESDSEIESDLEEDIVFGKLFDFSRDWVFIVLTVLIKKMFDILPWKQ